MTAAENRRKVALLQAGGKGAQQLLDRYAETNRKDRERRAQLVAKRPPVRRRTPRRRARGKVEAPFPVASESTGDRFIREYRAELEEAR